MTSPGKVTIEQRPLIAETQLAESDAAIARHQLVQATPEATYAAALDLDFLSVRDPLLISAFWLRGLPARITGRAEPEIPRLVLGEGNPLPGWLVLGTDPPREVAFGAVGKFWQPRIEWRDVGLEDFRDFSEPGYGKIACSFVITPYGSSRSLLTYECRTVTTDAASRTKFLRYWILVRPVVGRVLASTVRTLQAQAESRVQ